MPNPIDDCDDDEFDYTYAESALGYGGVIIGPDGIKRPLAEAEALARVIPEWVRIP